MNIVEVCRLLESRHGCACQSEIGPAPADIDFYAPKASMAVITAFLKQEGFILTGRNDMQKVFRRFENGALYILDLLQDFNIYTQHVPSLSLSAQGNSAIGASATLHKSFKNLCLNQTGKTAYLEAHRGELAAFLTNEKNFSWISPSIVAAAHGPVPLLMQSVWRPYADWKFLPRLLRCRIMAPINQRLGMLGKGFSVAFVGPDGSGKSFIIEKFLPSGPTRVIYMGDWFFVCQRFYNFLLKIRPPYNRVVYALYPFENYLRRIKVIWLRLHGKIVLIDRFPGTNRNVIHKGALKRLNDLVFSIFPKPDLLVLLEAPPEIVHRRKQELSVHEIGQIQDELRIILKGTRHIVLDTMRLDESLNRLLTIVHARLDDKVHVAEAGP